DTPSPLLEAGVKPGTVLVIGAGDGVLSSLGTGAVRQGQLTAMIGTSGAVRLLSPVPKTDFRGRTWCYNLSKDWWVLGGAINNGGLAYRWIRDNFMGSEVAEAKEKGWESYEVINQKAWEIPPGAGGLIFLPYLTGERSPYWNANARGVLFGLGLQHTRYHVARATVEGVVFRMLSVFQALEDLGGPVGEVRLSGGVTSSRLWVQTVADVFQREVLLPENHGSGFGAWILLQHAQGKLKSLLEAEHLVGRMEKYQPRPELAGLYRELFELYNRVYEKLQGEFLQISNLQRGMLNL
ncbi:MAG: FGGY-family carbohydrate kinase, partial [Desulfitobacteriaceae bacterium]